MKDDSEAWIMHPWTDIDLGASLPQAVLGYPKVGGRDWIRSIQKASFVLVVALAFVVVRDSLHNSAAKRGGSPAGRGGSKGSWPKAVEGPPSAIGLPPSCYEKTIAAGNTPFVQPSAEHLVYYLRATSSTLRRGRRGYLDYSHGGGRLKGKFRRGMKNRRWRDTWRSKEADPEKGRNVTKRSKGKSSQRKKLAWRGTRKHLKRRRGRK